MLKLFLGFVLISSSALATSFLARPFEDTVKDSQIILRGNIGSQIYSDWVTLPSDGTKRLFTFYELKITENVKGDAPSTGTLFFRQMGGEKNGVGMMIPGAAEFKRSEDVVVLLAPKNTDGSYDLVSLMMGKYEVVKDENGEEVLRGPGITETSGIVHDRHDEHGHSRDAHTDTEPVKKWTLKSLRDLVKNQGQKNGGSQKPVSSPTVTEAPSVAPSVSPVQASQLQSNEGEPSQQNDGGLGLWVYAAVAGVLLLLGWYIKK